MIIDENITNLICGGIEEGYFYFLVWKKILVLEAVIASWRTALAKGVADTLQQSEVLFLRRTRP